MFFFKKSRQGVDSNSNTQYERRVVLGERRNWGGGTQETREGGRRVGSTKLTRMKMPAGSLLLCMN